MPNSFGAPDPQPTEREVVTVEVASESDEAVDATVPGEQLHPSVTRRRCSVDSARVVLRRCAQAPGALLPLDKPVDGGPWRRLRHGSGG